MQRINTPTAVADMFGAGKPGFRDGNKAAGIAATELNAEFFNTIQEEIAAVVEGQGIALNSAARNQLDTAIRRAGLGGTAQAWADYTTSRALNTNYMNTTGRPIVVSAGGKATGAIGFYTLYVNTITAASMNVPDGHTFRLTAVVPPGAYVQLGKGGADTINNFSWSELR